MASAPEQKGKGGDDSRRAGSELSWAAASGEDRYDADEAGGDGGGSVFGLFAGGGVALSGD